MILKQNPETGIVEAWEGDVVIGQIYTMGEFITADSGSDEPPEERSHEED